MEAKADAKAGEVCSSPAKKSVLPNTALNYI